MDRQQRGPGALLVGAIQAVLHERSWWLFRQHEYGGMPPFSWLEMRRRAALTLRSVMTFRLVFNLEKVRAVCSCFEILCNMARGELFLNGAAFMEELVNVTFCPCLQSAM